MSDNKQWVPPRDYVGYGFDGPSVKWPGDNVIAVNFVLNYEEGAETTPWNGDDGSCTFLHELSYARPATTGGQRDGLVEDMFEWGLRQGLPRLTKEFNKYGWKYTTWACGRAFETSPKYAKMIADDGHEIACHGNRWMMHGTNGLEARAHVEKSFERLQKSTGLKDVPTGWFGNGVPMHTKLARAEVHKEKGVPLLYCSDAYNADVPYWVRDPVAAVHGGEDKGMLMIPYNLVTNDHRFFQSKGAGVSKPHDWFELLKGEFDCLYEEGKEGQPKMMLVAMHNRFVTKPGRFMALKRFMAYIADKPNVWVCTRKQIAEHWREHYPYEKVGPLDQKNPTLQASDELSQHGH